MSPTLFQELYAKQIVNTTSVNIPIIPTLIEDIYNVSKLLFNKTVKEFFTVDEAERWARDVEIVIRHKAGYIVGDNMVERSSG